MARIVCLHLDGQAFFDVPTRHSVFIAPVSWEDGCLVHVVRDIGRESCPVCFQLIYLLSPRYSNDSFFLFLFLAQFEVMASFVRFSVLAAFITTISGYAIGVIPTQTVGYGSPFLQEPTEAPSMELVKKSLGKRALINTCTEWTIPGGS